MTDLLRISRKSRLVLLCLLGAHLQANLAFSQLTKASTEVVAFFDEVGIVVDGSFVPVNEATDEQLAANPPLLENHTEAHVPLLWPDGTTPVTHDDFAALSGTATLTYLGASGTQAEMNLTGLIPGGVYTIWADYFEAPGFTPDFAHELGLGALGYDGINPPSNPQEFVGNLIVADETGHGELTVVQPPGPVSWFNTELGDARGFTVPENLLDSSVFELDLVVAYHLDGNTWGDRPGAALGLDSFDATWVGQGIGVFVVPEPSGMMMIAFSMLFAGTLRIRRKRRALAT